VEDERAYCERVRSQHAAAHALARDLSAEEQAAYEAMIQDFRSVAAAARELLLADTDGEYPAEDGPSATGANHESRARAWEAIRPLQKTPAEFAVMRARNRRTAAYQSKQCARRSRRVAGGRRQRFGGRRSRARSPGGRPEPEPPLARRRAA